MAATPKGQSKKSGPEPPDVPPELDPAPESLQSGAFWDCVEADQSVEVPERVVDIKLRESLWTGGDFVGKTLGGLVGLDTRFVGCDFSGAILTGAILTRVTFTDCRLTGAVFGGAGLNDVRFTDCRAADTSFRMAKAKFLLIENSLLRGADFYEASLTQTALLDCDLTEANFLDAKLSGVRLHGSTLDELQGVLSLKGAEIDMQQLVILAPALFGAAGIRITERKD